MELRSAKRRMPENEADEIIRTSNITTTRFPAPKPKRRKTSNYVVNYFTQTPSNTKKTTLPPTKGRKRSDLMSESTRAAIYSENINKPDSSCSVYDWYYNQTFYVDKTLLIKELFAIHHALITAPSRFGKSLNMDMVRRFFEIEVDEDGKQIDHDVEEDELVLKEVQSQSKNFKLFHGKKISSDKEFMFKHFGSYPTIYVDFTRVNGSNFEQILDGLRLVIHRAFRKHAYLKKSDLWNREEFNKNTFMKYFDTDQYESLSLAQIKCGLVFLSEVLHAYYGKKVFVFIDEFDIPVNSMVYEDDMDPEDRKETLKVLREIIGDLLKGSEKTVERSLSNACQQLGGILSGSANNVKLCAFLQKHALVEFYGFNELEVKDLLEKAGLSDNLEKVRDMYDGYEPTLKNGLNIHLYSPWAVINYLTTKQFSKYWSSGIPKGIEEAMGNPKIATKIREMMSGESVRIEYHGKMTIDHIDALNKMICRNKIDKFHVDLCLQFLYELGFFYPTFVSNDHLKLRLPNQSARIAIIDNLYYVKFLKKYFNHDPKFIKKFTNSVKNLAKACQKRRVDIEGYARIKNKVRILAINIDTLFSNGIRHPRNEQEFQSALYIYLNQQFDYVACQCITRDDNVCDIVIVIENVMFIIECKNFYKSAPKAHEQIIVKKYCTLAETASLKYIFGDFIPTIKDIIRLGIHIDRNCKTSIAYSFADTKMEIINSR